MTYGYVVQSLWETLVQKLCNTLWHWVTVRVTISETHVLSSVQQLVQHLTYISDSRTLERVCIPAFNHYLIPGEVIIS